MRVGARFVWGGFGVAMVLWATVAGVAARQRTEGGPMSDTFFKNVQILKGIPIDEFMGTMGFFSASTGLNIGPIVTRVDYSDYRDVSGVKMPFKWIVSWLNGRSIYELASVQPNVQVDEARFARPTSPVASRP